MSKIYRFGKKFGTATILPLTALLAVPLLSSVCSEVEKMLLYAQCRTLLDVAVHALLLTALTVVLHEAAHYLVFRLFKLKPRIRLCRLGIAQIVDSARGDQIFITALAPTLAAVVILLLVPCTDYFTALLRASSVISIVASGGDYVVAGLLVSLALRHHVNLSRLQLRYIWDRQEVEIRVFS